MLGRYVWKYTKEEKIGEGTYAVIYRGREYKVDEAEDTGEIFGDVAPGKAVQSRQVAIKRIKTVENRSGIEVSALREIKHLKRINSEYIIRLINVFEHENHIHLVLDYMESNLEVLIRSKKLVFMPQDVKSWMLMICRGIYECHSRFIVHRDLKPNNILVSRGGMLKLADFGLSTDLGFPVREMTNQVITRWYRAPELLLGGTNYAFGVDIWALGCVFAELLLRTPYLPGTDDVHQLDLTYAALGTPSEDDWPGIRHLPGYKMSL